jgi:hypothetical protein
LRARHWEIFKDVGAVEFRDSEAKGTVRKLGVEVGAVNQEIGTMEREAEVHMEKAGGDHCDPG